MWSMPVVLVSPWLQVLEPMGGVFVASGVGPFSEGSLDEAFGFAVGLGAVGSGAAVADGQCGAGAAELQTVEAWTVVGEHAADLDIEALEPGGGALQEVDRRYCLFVGIHRRI